MTIPDEILQRMKGGTGVTTRFLADKLSIKISEASAMLRQSGAIRDHSARYYFAGTRGPAPEHRPTSFGPSPFRPE